MILGYHIQNKYYMNVFKVVPYSHSVLCNVSLHDIMKYKNIPNNTETIQPKSDNSAGMLENPVRIPSVAIKKTVYTPNSRNKFQY